MTFLSSLRQKKYQRGFTLLELLVVISIIAILIALASVSFTTAQKKSLNARRRGDMKSVQNTFEQYYAANSSAYAACATMASGFSTGSLPADPKNISPYTYTFTCDTTAQTYCVCARLENENGNSSDSSCTFVSSGGTFFCVKNLQ
jgi:prepilin-type N-terminal cleavage/methylation domain-containing protein